MGYIRGDRTKRTDWGTRTNSAEQFDSESCKDEEEKEEE